MTSILKISLLLLISFQSFSQEKTYCTFTNTETQKTLRLEYSVSLAEHNGAYETNYLLTDKNNFPYKAISAINNIKERKIIISVRELNTGKEEINYPYKYSEFSGLIMNELYDTVSKLNTPYNYLYLITFQDEKKEYVKLYFLSDIGNYSIQFGTISNEEIIRSNKYLQQLESYKKLLKEQEEKQKQENALNRKIDSLVQIKLEQKLGKTTAQEVEVQKPPIPLSYREKHPEFTPSEFTANLLNTASNFYRLYRKDSVEMYQLKNKIITEIKSNSPHLLNKLSNDINYKVTGHFNENYVWQHNKEYDYYGVAEQKIKQGQGLQFFPNGNYFLGDFTNDFFSSGYAFINESLLGDYFGGYTNFKNTGYGESKIDAQTFSVGVFKNSSLENGFIKYTKPNSIQYIKIENGSNKGEDSENGEYFFEQIAKIKFK